METKLLSAACGDRSAFNLIMSNRAKGAFSDKGQIVLDEIGRYYDADPDAPRADKDILVDRLARGYPKHEELFRTLVGNLEMVSIPNVITEVMALRKKAVKDQLAAACAVDKDNDDEIAKLYAELERIQIKEDHTLDTSLYISTSASEVVEKTTGENLIQLHPMDINDALGGGVIRKHHIVVFARPDVGKTTFALNFAKGFLKQGLRTLYIGNEDPAHHILKRMMCLLTRMTAKEIDANPAKADAILAKRNWDKFLFAELSPGTPAEIRALVDEFQPDALIVDQARNLDMRDSNRVLQLEKACKFVRDISKQNNMVGISFVQAGDSAEGSLILNMGDVDFSNTGIPATADLMIGVGCNTEYELGGRRMISFPKNKINGNKEPICVPIEFNTFSIG